MRRNFDPYFQLFVAFPLVVGMVLVLYALATTFTPLSGGLIAFGTAVPAIVLGIGIWAAFGVRIESDQWYVRYFLGREEYLYNCWFLFVPRFMKAWPFDHRIREIITERELHRPTTVVAQIFLTDEEAEADTDGTMVFGQRIRASQSFVLVFQIGYQLMRGKEQRILEAYLDNIVEHGDSLNGSVARVIRERLSDLVNQVFQPRSEEALTIEDVINRRQMVNEALLPLLQKDMEGYATHIITVLIQEEPRDAVPNGYLAERNRAIAERNKADVDRDVAKRRADAIVKQAEENRRAEEARQASEMAILVASQKREEERIKLMRLQAQSATQQMLVEQEMFKNVPSDVELRRQMAGKPDVRNPAFLALIGETIAQILAQMLGGTEPSESSS